MESVAREGRGARPPGVGVADNLAYGEGDALREEAPEVRGRGLEVLCGSWVELVEAGGILKYRREVVLGRPMLLRRLEPFIAGEASRLLPLAGPRATEEAGELPGVSMALLPVADRSLETILEIESRSCWSLFIVRSSKAASIPFI